MVFFLVFFPPLGFLGRGAGISSSSLVGRSDVAVFFCGGGDG